MKRILSLILCACMLLSFAACTAKGDGDDTTAADTTDKVIEETKKEEPKEKYKDILSLEKLNGISKISETSIGLDNVLAFSVRYRLNGVSETAFITAPLDYEEKNCPVVINYCEGSISPRDDARLFAINGFIGITLTENEDSYDLGDKEAAKAGFFADILAKAAFSKESKIFVAGKGLRSVCAFSAAKLLGDKLAGVLCADPVADLAKQYSDNRTSRDVCFGIIGAKPAVNAEAYDSRSAVKFADKLLCPVLLITYTENADYAATQGEALKAVLDVAKKSVTYVCVEGESVGFLSQQAEEAFYNFIKK